MVKNAIERAVDMHGSQYALAKKAGITYNYVRDALRNGRTGPRHAVLLEKVTGIPREQFVWPGYVAGVVIEQSEKCEPDSTTEKTESADSTTDNSEECPQGAN